jgi:hypothetical protein
MMSVDDKLEPVRNEAGDTERLISDGLKKYF